MSLISSQTGYLLEHALIDWHDESSPWSEAFADIYWHREGGLAEKQHVFIEANHLRERWSDLQQPQFNILETGFGFGLNFLLAARLWQELAPPGKLLHYQAIEYAPVTLTDLARLYASLCPPNRVLVNCMIWPSASRVDIPYLRTACTHCGSPTRSASI